MLLNECLLAATCHSTVFTEQRIPDTGKERVQVQYSHDSRQCRKWSSAESAAGLLITREVINFGQINNSELAS